MLALYHGIESDVRRTTRGAARRVIQDIDTSVRGNEDNSLKNPSSIAGEENSKKNISDSSSRIAAKRAGEVRLQGLFLVASTFIRLGGEREQGLEYFRKEISKHSSDSR